MMECTYLHWPQVSQHWVGQIRQGLTGTMEHPSSDDSIHGFLSSGTRVGVLELERLVRAQGIGGRLLQAQL